MIIKCSECNQDFESSYSDKKYCTPLCKRRARAKRQPPQKRNRTGQKRLLCEHNKRRSRCEKCGTGGEICQHGVRRARCKSCDGREICGHGVHAYYCRECPGKGICQHKKMRKDCRDCQQKKRTCRQCKAKFYLPEVTPYCSPECRQKHENKKTCRICCICQAEFHTELETCGERCAEVLRAAFTSNHRTRHAKLMEEIDVSGLPKDNTIKDLKVYGNIWTSLEGRCYYCSRSLINQGAGHGIIRKDFTVGYLPDNLVPCCFFCSSERQTKTHEELILLRPAGLKFRKELEARLFRKEEKRKQSLRKYQELSELLEKK